MKCHPWEPIPGIIGPAADISFSYSGGRVAVATMHFSRVIGLPPKDLQIQFTGAVALRWELECPGFDPLPKKLPKCSSPEWSRWTFPLLEIDDSPWLELYSPIYQGLGASRLSHFLLISMDDLVQIIARSDATARWVPAQDDPTGHAD